MMFLHIMYVEPNMVANFKASILQFMNLSKTWFAQKSSVDI